MQRTHRKWLFLVLGLAFALRLALALWHPFYFDDSRDYQALADNVLHHQIYQIDAEHRATRMPGYPLLLVLLGNSATALLVLQAFCGAGIVYVIYLLARPTSERAGVIAAFLAAVDPLSIAFSAAILSETPFTLLLLLALYQSIRIVQGPSFGRFILLAVTWSGAVYLRASVLWCVIPVLLVIVLFGRKSNVESRKFSFTLPGGLITLVLIFAALLPWQLRNYAHFREHFFRLTTLEGISLYEAVYPEATGGPRQDKIAVPPGMVTLNESQRDAEWSRRAWQEIRGNPGRIFRLVPIKLGRLWSPVLNAEEYKAPAVQIALGLWHIPLYVLAFLGVLRTRRPLRTFLLVPILYFSLLHCLFMGSVRYRVPLMPIICLFAAFGVLSLIERLFGRKPDTRLSV